MTNTSHYGLKEIGPGDQISDEGYKFGTTDRETIDLELYRAATHHHIGGSLAITAPASAPSLTLQIDTSIGSLAPGTRYYYRYTFIDANGLESTASPEGFIDTAPPVDAPNAPTLSTSAIGGSLTSGTYYYALTAYDPDSSHETLALNAANVATAVGSTNTNTITFPTLPAGAHGFNIYRRVPGGLGYLFLTAVSLNVATPPTSWTDTGAVLADCDRTLPTTNTTNLDQSIQVCLGGATPTIPAGYIWRIYRTATAGNYSSSLLTTIDTGAVCYTDTGLGTTSGAPPTQSGLDHPDKVLLTDAAEVQGTLPMGMTAFPYCFTYAYAGPVTTITGSFLWICDFPAAQIVAVRAVLGRGKKPASQSVIIDINKGTGTATPTFQTIFATTPEKPYIVVGSEIGVRARPTLSRALMNQGDVLTADILQAGGGATPTDSDLTIQVTMIVYGYPLTSFVAGAVPTGY